jgi:hypothetical protein
MNHVEVAHKDSHEVAPISLSRLARTLNAYRGPIVLSLAAILFLYIVITGFIIFTAPARRVTSQSFQLEFEGAETGHYPNGTDFSPSEIVSVPILDRVYKSNNLKEFLPFTVFAQSVYVVEANQALEALTREYQARLSDPKLNPVDRERIVREFESKKNSISKNQYSVNFSTPKREHQLPGALAKKVLGDVLSEWANYATREQRILQYQVAVLSPNTFDPRPNANLNYIARLQVLRSNIYRVIANIEQIENLPGAKLAQTRNDRLTLNDIRVGLEDLVRFRLEPLVPAIRSSGLIDVNAAIRFVESQLGHDERMLAVMRTRAEVIRQSLNAYSNRRETQPDNPTTTTGPVSETRPADDISPTLTEGFLERLVSITSAASDMAYRQRLVDDYRLASTLVIPAETAVAYNREVLAQLRGAPATQSGVTAENVEQQLADMQAQLQEAIKKVNELYATISRNLEPDTYLFTTTGVPSTRTDRAIDLFRLIGLGALILLLSIPLVIAGVLIHNRMRQEDEAELLQ